MSQIVHAPPGGVAWNEIDLLEIFNLNFSKIFLYSCLINDQPKLVSKQIGRITNSLYNHRFGAGLMDDE